MDRETEEEVLERLEALEAFQARVILALPEVFEEDGDPDDVEDVLEDSDEATSDGDDLPEDETEE